MMTNRLRPAALAMLAALAVTAFAQQNDAEPALRKDADEFARVKFTRQAEEAFRAAAAVEDPDWDEPTRLLHWVQAGKWREVAKLLAQFEAEPARRIHAKIMSDLAFARPESMMLPEDVLALADASPVELDGKQVTHVGNLLRVTMRDTESRAELMKVLLRGTKRLGGDEEDRRKLTAQILADAQLYEEAKAFGMNDAALRAASGGGYVGSEASPLVGAPPWNETLKALRDDAGDASSRDKALDDIHQHLLASTPQVVRQRLQQILADKKHPEMVRLVFGMIGRKTAAASREVDMTARAIHLEMQHLAMRQLADTVGFEEEAWRTLAQLAAASWLAEARHSRTEFPIWQRTTGLRRGSHAHVPVEQMIQCAPSRAWLDATGPQLAAFVRITLTQLILLSEDIDRAIPQIQALQQSDKPSAAELANAYLERWAQQHDPNLSDEMLQEYKRDKQVVVLTRAQQESSLAQLGALLSSLAPETRALLDEEHLVRAFDFCHSRAEVHTREHVRKVFGPVKELPASLAVKLVEQMRDKLALQWRELSVQRDAATQRTAEDVFALVSEGYAQAAEIAEEWLAAHAGAWPMECVAGSLYADWGEFAYFQGVAAESDDARFTEYLEHSRQALVHFRAGAEAYASTVPKLAREDFELKPYRAWFYGLLGITHDRGVNLRKGVTPQHLKELRQAMLELPDGADEVHLQLFSTMVAENIEADRIAPEMKYRYLSSAVAVTGSRPTVYPAEEKIKYYDSLLEEIRLQTRIDGEDRIRAGGEFGLLVSLVHTTDVARESGGFSKYLMNQVQRTYSGRTVVEQPLYRDRFEESLRIALGGFFDIRTIAFAKPTDPPRDIGSPDGALDDAPDRRWQETPLCYVLLATRDTTVDRVPALEIELDFFDREGKVVLPVPSNPLQIEISDDAPNRRPVRNIEITQIVDSRELADNRLMIDVSAAADGLVPELDQLLDLADYSLPIREVVDQGGLQVRELHNGPDGLYVQSERSWKLLLDPTPLMRGARQRVEFEFPAAAAAETAMIFRRYEDLDPVEAAAKVTLLEGDDVSQLALIDYRVWVAGGVATALVLAGLALLVWRGAQRKPPEAPPLFTPPAEFTPFSVIALLHRIQSSPRVSLTEEQRNSLQRDIRALEQQAFAASGGAAQDKSLEQLARRWLDTALASQPPSSQQPAPSKTPPALVRA
ncbi:MAG: hypothetical protein RIC55_24000 [Pirellulaceae bacterium]